MASWIASFVAASVIGTLGLNACTSEADSEAKSQVTRTPAEDSSTAASTCEAVPPQRLPSGAAAGAPQPRGDQQFVWGDGRDQVIQQVGGNPLGVAKNWPQRVEFRDTQALVVPIGDPGQIAFMFTLDGCTYTTWIGPGITLADAQDYISSY
jgi:hypothetical protein